MTPAQTYVERVARAIHAVHGVEWDWLTSGRVDARMREARAAIAAVQPSLSDMLDARADEIQRDHLPVSAVNELRDAAKAIRAILMGVE